MHEVWKPIIGYEGLYEVSDLGRVRSVTRVCAHSHAGHTRTVPSKLRRLNRTRHGYDQVCLFSGSAVSKTILVSRLVLEAFVGPAPVGMEACHNDGDKTNNSLANLRWDTRKANHADKRQHGTHREGVEIHCAKLTDTDVRQIKTALQQTSQTALARRFGVTQATISAIATGKTWKHV